MGADVRIEIIYFKQDSDIKLEFGLSSDYPIRLLTNKASDEISFLKKLKTASLRSPIIITVGGFEEKDVYLPELVSKATNIEMTEVDYGKYKTENSGTIRLPEGALPIIHSDGTFNGCVIESGPQSIIMLPEDDKNRMNLLKELIVPYISEHYRTYNLVDESSAEDLSKHSKEEPDSTEEQPVQPSEDFDDLSSGNDIEFNSVPINNVEQDILYDLCTEYNDKKHKTKKSKGSKGVTAVVIITSCILALTMAVLGYCVYKYFF